MHLKRQRTTTKKDDTIYGFLYGYMKLFVCVLYVNVLLLYVIIYLTIIAHYKEMKIKKPTFT